MLKKCACGGESDMNNTNLVGKEVFFVICTDCDVHTICYETEEIAADHWNRLFSVDSKQSD